MMLFVHIVLAFSSIIFLGYAVISPSPKKIKIAFYLVIAVILSGGVLAVTGNMPLGKVCLAGLLYLLVVTSILVLAKNRLAGIKAYYGN